MLLEKSFKPTWLYIKQHNVTGLKYFGKTVRKDPIKYKGSGTYWTRHLATHGYDITTTWLQLFTSKDDLVEFALTFSKENNIIESSEWANLEFEDGLSGSGYYRKCSQETIEKRVKANTGKTRTAEQKERMSIAQKELAKLITPNQKAERSAKASKSLKGRKVVITEETKAKISESLTGVMKGVPKSEETKQKMRKPKSEEHKRAISEARKTLGIKRRAERDALNNL